MKRRDSRVICEGILRQVSRYLDGDLTPAKCRAVEQHCRTCASCRRRAGAVCRMIGLCRRAGRRRVPAAVTKRAAATARRLIARQGSGLDAA
jgi:anti-sigma factor RsiW